MLPKKKKAWVFAQASSKGTAYLEARTTSFSIF